VDKPDSSVEPQSLKERLNLETAKIGWHELQRYYAAGNVVVVDHSLDLFIVAEALIEDNAPLIHQWMKAGKVSGPTTEQAQDWYDAEAMFWAVVIAPWVLIQPSSGD